MPKMSYPVGRLSDELPGYQTIVKQLRHQEVLRISRGLLLCAGICLLRAAIVPWYLHFMGRLGKGPSDLEIVATSLILAIVFVVASALSWISCRVAVLISLIGFAAICVRDYLSCPDIEAQGLIFKTILMILLLRCVFSALINRVI